MLLFFHVSIMLVFTSLNVFYILNFSLVNPWTEICLCLTNIGKLTSLKKKLLPLFLLVRRVHSFFPFLDKAHWILQRKILILYLSCLNFLLCLLFASGDFHPEINLWIRGAFFCLFRECKSQRGKTISYKFHLKWESPDKSYKKGSFWVSDFT